MEKLEIHQSKIDNYLEDTLINLESEKTEKEVEFKVFLEGEEDRDKILEFHGKLQNIVISSLKGKIIFDGEIKDIRYYNSEDNKLDEKRISMIRVRNQTDKNTSRTESIYSVKQRIGDSKEDGYEELEYETDVDNNFGEKILIERYGLEEIKKSVKIRKEIEFEIYVSGQKEKIKVAFDEYIDDENKNVLPFFEVEAKSKEIADKGFEEIKKLFPGVKYKTMNGGVRKYKEEQKRNKLKEEFNISGKKIIDDIAFSTLLLIENESIFTIVNDLKKTGLDEKIEDKKIKKVFRGIKILAIKEIKKLIGIDSNYEKYFNRIINIDEKGNIKMGKKFNDKFEREFSGYYKAFISSILTSSKGKKREEIVSIIKNKLDIFIKTIFMFDDSLNKDELEDFLNKPKSDISEIFEKYSVNIKKLIKYGGNINSLLTIYSRTHSTIAFKNKNLKNKKNKNKEIVKENIEKMISELFIYLSQSFSVLINTQKPEDESIEIFNTIRYLFLDVYKFIFILKEEGIVFEDKKYPDDLDHHFFQAINNEYHKELYDENNFLLEDIGPVALKIFLWHISDGGYSYSSIKSIFDEHNNENILRLLKDNNSENKKTKNKGFISNEISFELWEKLNSDSRLRTFINDVLVFDKNKFNIDKKIIHHEFTLKNKHTKLFIDTEFKKRFSKNNIPDKNSGDKYKEYKNYKDNVIRQFNELNRNKYKNIDDFISKDINTFHLLVEWFHFNLENKNLSWSGEKNKLHSQSFTEQVITKISENGKLKIDKDGNLENNLGYEFIPTTSKSYNTSQWGSNSIKTFFNRICNLKSINLDKNYYFNTDIETKFFKNYNKFYIPNTDDKSIENIYEYIDNNIEIIRKLYNDDEITSKANNDLIDFLGKINFPIEDKVLLKKLMEFLKFIYKEVVLVLDKSNKEKNNNTNNFAKELFSTFDKNKLGNIDVAVPKNVDRSLTKNVQKHGGRGEKVGDEIRATFLVDDFEDMVYEVSNFLVKQSDNENILSIRLDDKVGNIFKKAKRDNGYRDSKLMITFKDGTTAELQFQFKDYYKIKHNKIKLNKNLRKKITDNISFSENEKNIIVEHCKYIDKKIPKDFSNLFNLDNFEEGIQFNADFTYNISRSITNKSIKNKINELDRIIFDNANSIVAKKEVNRIMGYKKNNK